MKTGAPTGTLRVLRDSQIEQLHSEPFFWDHRLGRPRRPTKADVVACTRVGQALPNIDFILATSAPIALSSAAEEALARALTKATGEVVN